MCGRFAQKTPAKELKQQYNTVNEVEYAARYNIAPTTPVIVIHATPYGDRLMEPMRWGLIPSWAKDISIGNKMINARAETIEEKPSYKKAFIRRRCVIPVTGFYEWHTETRQPYLFQPAIRPGVACRNMGTLDGRGRERSSHLRHNHHGRQPHDATYSSPHAGHFGAGCLQNERPAQMAFQSNGAQAERSVM